MPGMKLVVIYPRPRDIGAFEQVYQKEHGHRNCEELGSISLTLL